MKYHDNLKECFSILIYIYTILINSVLLDLLAFYFFY